MMCFDGVHAVGGGGGDATTTSQSQTGYHLRWCRLTKTVDLNRKEGGGLVGHGSSISTSFRNSEQPRNKVILDNVSGYAAPAQVLALMGPSGSGKTSLLNTLSGRSTYQSGNLSINGGDPINAVMLKRLMRNVGYVKQADIFFGHLTVRDQLTYTALLRSPGPHHDESVNRVLRLLRLEKVADSPINMLSGGERKRVNIGTELLTDPALLLLDVS